MHDDETFVFLGQENMVRLQRAGSLEAHLALNFAPASPRFRWMAWEADTVYEQWRDLNFGSWPAQLEAVGATAIIAQFGKMEALDGPARLAAFRADLHHLLDQLAPVTSRLILLSPTPFEEPDRRLYPDAPDLSQRNDDLESYLAVLREVARQRGALFIDLYTPFLSQNERLSEDGIHLTARGGELVARVLAEKLARAAGRQPLSDEKQLARLRPQVAEKNRLWFDCWRPANWSFVYGDRVSQLFGKAAGDEPTLQAAFENNKQLIARLDARIHAAARGEEIPPAQAPVADEKSTPVADAEEVLASFELADGYEIGLFASEAQGVSKPTQVTWDERGRMYVACSPTYPQRVSAMEARDFILVLEDADGDGRAERSWKFAEGLTMVQGLVVGDGGLYVCDFDRLLHFADKDGDGRAEESRVVLSGFGIGDTHQLINSITRGPEGDLWFTQGLHAFSHVETPHGIARLDKSGIWRLNPRTLELKGYFNGAKAGHNDWGVAFDDNLQVFHKSGDRPHGYYSVPGLVSYAEPEEFHPLGALFASSPKTTGLDFIGTSALPDEIQGCAVIGGYFGHVVELHRLVDEGSGFRSEQLPRLVTSSEKSFRPVEVQVGPDGAIYLADWCNPVIGHYQASYADPARDRVHGRIWRVRASGRTALSPPDFATFSWRQLLDHLGTRERWEREQAKRLLFDGPEAEVLAALDDWVAALDLARAKDRHLLMEGLGVFAAHGRARVDLLAQLAGAEEAPLRAYAARLAGRWSAEDVLQNLIADEEARVRLEAVVAAAELPSERGVPLALRALEQPMDPFLTYALRQTLRKGRAAWKGKLATGEFSPQGRALLEKLALPEAATHPGRKIYDMLCLNCHQADGKGLPGVYPPLAGTDWLLAEGEEGKERLIKVLLHGLSGPIAVNGKPFESAAPLVMPPMGLDDAHVAQVLTWLRREAFGQAKKPASAITPEEVRTLREAHGGRTTPWTAEELAR